MLHGSARSKKADMKPFSSTYRRVIPMVTNVSVRHRPENVLAPARKRVACKCIGATYLEKLQTLKETSLLISSVCLILEVERIVGCFALVTDVSHVRGPVVQL